MQVQQESQSSETSPTIARHPIEIFRMHDAAYGPGLLLSIVAVTGLRKYPVGTRWALAYLR